MRRLSRSLPVRLRVMESTIKTTMICGLTIAGLDEKEAQAILTLVDEVLESPPFLREEVYRLINTRNRVSERLSVIKFGSQ